MDEMNEMRSTVFCGGWGCRSGWRDGSTYECSKIESRCCCCRCCESCDRLRQRHLCRDVSSWCLRIDVIPRPDVGLLLMLKQQLYSWPSSWTQIVKFIMKVVGEQRENCLVVDYGRQYWAEYEFQSGVFKVKWNLWKAQAGKRKI